MFQFKPFFKYTFYLSLAVLLPLQVFAYHKPRHIDQEIWEKAEPYLLPEDTSIKKKLDKIFSEERFTLNKERLKDAGFKLSKHHRLHRPYVCKHHDFHDYILKIYTDDQLGINELDHFINRIKGAKATQKAIVKHGVERIFKVPVKYLYPLPEWVDVPSGKYERKNFVLVVQNMHLSCHEYNKLQWEDIQKPKLKYLHKIIEEVGLQDCVRFSNIPFCKDMRIAFTDTEHYHKWPVKYEKLNSHLEKHDLTYWKKITRQSSNSRSD